MSEALRFNPMEDWEPDSPEEAWPFDPADEPGTPEHDAILEAERMEDWRAEMRREFGDG